MADYWEARRDGVVISHGPKKTMPNAENGEKNSFEELPNLREWWNISILRNRKSIPKEAARIW